MVKINNKTKEAKPKLNLISNNSVTRMKISKKENKKLKKSLNHVKFNINSDNLDLTVNSSGINFAGSRNNHSEHDENEMKKPVKESKNNKKSYMKLFRQSKAQRNQTENTEKTSSANKISDQIAKEIISKEKLPTKRTKITDTQQPVTELPAVVQIKPIQTNNLKATKSSVISSNPPGNSSNGIDKKRKTSRLDKNPKRKFYENGWYVEELTENGHHSENDSSDSDRDSYLDKFFNDDDQEEFETETNKRSKQQKCMLLVSNSNQPSENSDDSIESSPVNFVKLKTKPKPILQEQSSSEMVPYVPNEEDVMTSDSEYDPSWNSSSDDQYEGMSDENEYIEYSAEEVESDSEDNLEYESTDLESFSDDEDDDFFGECMSDEDTYDSEDDEDYIPGINEDLYIHRGDAKIYDVHNNNISFNSDEGAQIFEINDSDLLNTSDNESCPELVPIASVKPVSLKTPEVILRCSVVDDILKESENELCSEDDDNLFSNISAYQTIESAPMDIDDKNNSDEEDCQEPDRRTSKFYNSSVSSHLVLLHLKEFVYFHGHFKVTLVHGSAKSFGYTFVLNKPIEFYSPSCDSLLYLESVDSGKSGKLNTKVLEEYFEPDIIKEITEGITHSSGDALLLLDYYESKRVESIRLYMRDEIFPMKQASQISRPFHSSEIRLKTNFIFSTSGNSDYRKLETETDWNKISMHSNSKLMVIGGKNVGKSSLIKYLINSNINRLRKILFIDFDIGQPEIYIPQTISATVIDFPILGPGCLYKVKPKKVLLFGDTTVTSEQVKYIHGCNMLIQYCTSNEELSAMPWVINTMGYNKGLGDEIIAAYIKTIKPTDVVQINSVRNADNYNQFFTPEFTNQFQFNMFTEEFKDNKAVCSHNLIAIEAFSKMYDRNVKGLLSAKDKRLMMTLAHLGDILDVNDAKWLTDAEVKKIKLNELHIFTSYSLDKYGCTVSLLKSVLDMTFVYLCNKNNDTTTETTADCIGCGLVRHVDNEMLVLYLITAVPDDDLELVNALALTNVTIAKAILEKQCMMVDGEIKNIGLSDNFIGTRQVQPQTYRPDTTVNTRSNFIK